MLIFGGGNGMLVHRVRVEAPCRPTEGVSKVKAAILNIFPDAKLEDQVGYIRGEATDLERFAELLRRQRIRASARELLQGSTRDGRMVFHLNKQAANVGRVSFSALSPLGDILVDIEADDLGALIDQIAPANP